MTQEYNICGQISSWNYLLHVTWNAKTADKDDRERHSCQLIEVIRRQRKPNENSRMKTEHKVSKTWKKSEEMNKISFQRYFNFEILLAYEICVGLGQKSPAKKTIINALRRLPAALPAVQIRRWIWCTHGRVPNRIDLRLWRRCLKQTSIARYAWAFFS